MKRILEPLAQIPGVRMALLVAHDGVPVMIKNATDSVAPDSAEAVAPESLAALAAGWLNELERSVGPLSWGSPQRVVLRAARGSLVMIHAPGALLLAIVDPRMSPDELRLPMEAAVVRMQRLLRPTQEPAAAPSVAVQAPALPSRPESKGRAPSRADTSL
ncbi:MAG TPA: roadblock/LC7 domain-containing protein [Planctomycetota bacterium]|nr:roadblock/LC7 domain-containing protein [Planctomycetota bacterium]